MKAPGALHARLVCVFLVGCLLFNFPLIALFNVEGRILGVPVLYAYLFAAWLVVIAMVASLMERRPE